MKGILLAGGSGSRLKPLTLVTNKHLLPIYNKPMIYYPLKNLIQAGIREIFIITGGEHFASIGRLLGSGRDLKEILGIGESCSFSYGVQDGAKGIADALGLAKQFAGNDNMAVILGDNIYEDENFMVEAVKSFSSGAHIFLKEILNNQLFEGEGNERRAKFGVAELLEHRVLSIEEKPKSPKANNAVTGAYLYDHRVFEIIKTLKPSWRNELEITDVNNDYVSEETLRYSFVNGFWTDAGSIDSLYLANTLIANKK